MPVEVVSNPGPRSSYALIGRKTQISFTDWNLCLKEFREAIVVIIPRL